jgi:hypothetical protein
MHAIPEPESARTYIIYPSLSYTELKLFLTAFFRFALGGAAFPVTFFVFTAIH